MTQKAAPRWGRSYTTTRSIEDTYPNQVFELTNATAQGRLPNEQDFRSAAKTAFICRGDGAAQLGKVNSRYPALEFHV